MSSRRYQVFLTLKKMLRMFLRIAKETVLLSVVFWYTCAIFKPLYNSFIEWEDIGTEVEEILLTLHHCLSSERLTDRTSIRFKIWSRTAFPNALMGKNWEEPARSSCIWLWECLLYLITAAGLVLLMFLRVLGDNSRKRWSSLPSHF